jgi:hypothetical protein
VVFFGGFWLLVLLLLWCGLFWVCGVGGIVGLCGCGFWVF